MGRSLIRAYDWLIHALAAAAGIIIVATFLAVVYDASIRDLGFQPSSWTVPSAEMGLLYVTLLAAPWLLRTNGQIVVQSLRQVLPARFQRVLETAIYAGCIIICVIITYYAIDQAIDAWRRGDVEERGISVPLYVGYAPLALGFLLLSCEFLRLLLGHGSIYERSGEGESI